MNEEIYKEARKTWNGSGQEARKILVRWFKKLFGGSKDETKRDT